jgi:hypothetical protein
VRVVSLCKSNFNSDTVVSLRCLLLSVVLSLPPFASATTGRGGGGGGWYGRCSTPACRPACLAFNVTIQARAVYAGAVTAQRWNPSFHASATSFSRPSVRPSWIRDEGTGYPYSSY